MRARRKESRQHATCASVHINMSSNRRVKQYARSRKSGGLEQLERSADPFNGVEKKKNQLDVEGNKTQSWYIGCRKENAVNNKQQDWQCRISLWAHEKHILFPWVSCFGGLFCSVWNSVINKKLWYLLGQNYFITLGIATFNYFSLHYCGYFKPHK